MLTRVRLFTSALLLFAATTMVSAQVVSMPKFLEFEPPADHATIVETIPMVTSYDVEIYAVSLPATPVVTFNIGKPDPVGGKITVNIENKLTMALPGGYFGRVVRVGPTGPGRSLPSNTFPWLGTAAPTLPTAVLFRSE